MFSISNFRNESGCFEQEKCPRVYLSSLRTKCTQDMLIFKVYFWRSKKLSDVVRRLTWSLTERERATCEDEWLNTSRTKVYSGHHLTEFGLSCEPPVTIRRSSRGELIKLRKSILCNNNHHMLITFSDTVQGLMRKNFQADNGSNYSLENINFILLQISEISPWHWAFSLWWLRLPRLPLSERIFVNFKLGPKSSHESLLHMIQKYHHTLNCYW